MESRFAPCSACSQYPALRYMVTRGSSPPRRVPKSPHPQCSIARRGERRPGVPFVPGKKEEKKDAEGKEEKDEKDDIASGPELLIGFAPGLVPMMLPPGQAKLVKGGSDIVFQMHYTATGKAGTDRSRIGLIFAKQPPKERIFTANATNSKFVIPPGDPAYRVDASITVQADARLVDVMPHMHFRGKDFEYRLVYPTGETQTVLNAHRVHRPFR